MVVRDQGKAKGPLGLGMAVTQAPAVMAVMGHLVVALLRVVVQGMAILADLLVPLGPQGLMEERRMDFRVVNQGVVILVLVMEDTASVAQRLLVDLAVALAFMEVAKRLQRLVLLYQEEVVKPVRKRRKNLVEPAS